MKVKYKVINWLVINLCSKKMELMMNKKVWTYTILQKKMVQTLNHQIRNSWSKTHSTSHRLEVELRQSNSTTKCRGKCLLTNKGKKCTSDSYQCNQMAREAGNHMKTYHLVTTSMTIWSSIKWRSMRSRVHLIWVETWWCLYRIKRDWVSNHSRK